MTEQESVGLRNAIDTISADFPEVPSAEVVSLVEREHARFDGRPVRDFVPVLVERVVRAQLHGRELVKAS